jgi:hypothetical protein
MSTEGTNNTAASGSGAASSDALRKEIATRRDSIRSILERTVRARHRLGLVSTVGSAVAAAATAGPALGGKTFTAWLVETLSLQAPAWQLLCGLAAVCSISAAIANQLSKSQKLDERAIAAQAVYAKLERLHVGLTLGEAAHARTSQEFLACLEEVAALEAV